MRKDFITFITILFGALIIFIIDFPDNTQILQNEGLYFSSLQNIEARDSFAEFKEVESEFWTYIKEGEESTQVYGYASRGKDGQSFHDVLFKPTPPPEPLALPIDLLMVGDSMMLEGFGPRFEKDLLEIGQINVNRFGKYSSGLNRRDYYDWHAFTDQKVNELEPDVLVVFFGANDGQKIYNSETKRTYLYGTKEWENTYRDRVRYFLRLVANDVRQMYWLGHPIPSTADFQGKFRIMNKIYKEETAKYENVDFVDAWERYTVNGRYSAYVRNDAGRNALAKASDGVHFTWHGAGIMSDLVEKYMREDIRF